MKTQCRRSEVWLLKLCSILLPLFITWGSSIAQVGNLNANTKAPVTSSLHVIAGNNADLFGTRTSYIKNIGQYGDTLSNYGRMGKILYGYQGLEMPVLFTSKGLIHLQRKIKSGSKAEDKATTIDRAMVRTYLGIRCKMKVALVIKPSQPSF